MASNIASFITASQAHSRLQVLRGALRQQSQLGCQEMQGLAALQLPRGLISVPFRTRNRGEIHEIEADSAWRKPTIESMSSFEAAVRLPKVSDSCCCTCFRL